MSIEVLGMFAASTGGTEDAAAQIDIPQDGFLVGIDWDARVLLDSNENWSCELSFIATNQLTTNDIRGRLSSISVGSEVVTAVGVVAVSIQKWIGSFDIRLSGGERVFLNISAAAGVVGTVRCGLFFDMTTSTVRRSARRR